LDCGGPPPLSPRHRHKPRSRRLGIASKPPLKRLFIRKPLILRLLNRNRQTKRSLRQPPAKLPRRSRELRRRSRELRQPSRELRQPSRELRQSSRELRELSPELRESFPKVRKSSPKVPKPLPEAGGMVFEAKSPFREHFSQVPPCFRTVPWNLCRGMVWEHSRPGCGPARPRAGLFKPFTPTLMPHRRCRRRGRRRLHPGRARSTNHATAEFSALRFRAVAQND